MGSDIRVRAIGEGDAATVAALYNAVYAPYASPAERTADDVEWRILRRPGVSPEAVFLAEVGGEPAGYTSVRSTGEILELAVTPGSNERAITDALIEAIETHADRHGIEQLSVNVPIDRPAVVDAFRAAGYGVGTVEHLYLSVDDLEQLVASRKPALVGSIQGTYLISLTDPYPWQQPEVCFTVTEDDVVLTDSTPDVAVKLSLADVADVVFARRPPSDFLSRENVEPAEAAPLATSLLASLSVKEPWFWSRSDVI